MATNDGFTDQSMARKIQVWSNLSESEFAVCLDIDSQHFRAKTDTTIPDEKFVKMVDETDFISDLKYYWAYTLEHWLLKHKEGRKKG